MITNVKLTQFELEYAKCDPDNIHQYFLDGLAIGLHHEDPICCKAYQIIADKHEALLSLVFGMNDTVSDAKKILEL